MIRLVVTVPPDAPASRDAKPSLRSVASPTPAVSVTPGWLCVFEKPPYHCLIVSPSTSGWLVVKTMPSSQVPGAPSSRTGGRGASCRIQFTPSWLVTSSMKIGPSLLPSVIRKTHRNPMYIDSYANALSP